VLEDWTAASRRMVNGQMIGTDNDNQDAPPDDTGEAVGLGPAALTLTFGFGASLFDRAGDPFRIAARKPAALAPMPVFARDEIRPDISEGDIAIQSCANDPTVAFHAIRDLARIGRGVVALRWSQQGFGRTSVTDSKQTTPRNLMGFKDGTNNIVVQDTAALDDHVWVGAKDCPAWMRNGSYLVTRRIRMMLEIWDRSTLSDQELTIGRNKQEGAPLGSAKAQGGVALAKQTIELKHRCRSNGGAPPPPCGRGLERGVHTGSPDAATPSLTLPHKGGGKRKERLNLGQPIPPSLRALAKQSIAKIFSADGVAEQFLPSGCLAPFRRLLRRLLRHLGAFTPRLGQPDRDRLLAACDLAAGAAALQRAGVALFHRALDLGRCLLGIFSCHDTSPGCARNNLGTRRWFP